MTPRNRRATWALLAALMVSYGVTGGAADNEPVVTSVTFTAMTLVYLGVGGLVATRLPTNPVGWLLCGTGVLIGLTSVTYEYAAQTLDLATGSGPGTGVVAAWITSWSWVPALLGVPALLFLLFPDGRPVRRPWGRVVWVVAAGVGCVLVGASLAEGGLTNSPSPSTPNPIGVLPRDTADGITTAGFVLSLVALLLAAVSLVVRLRRARGVERQQLKWLMWSAGPLAIYLATGLVRWAVDDSSGGLVAELLLATCLTTVPAAVGIAVLRYRLYDIDLVINRTLVYGALTASLAAAYLTSVLVLRVTLDPLTSGSDLAVAASTLAVAALFRPLRTRIQSLVDRRFYRARYDAVRTLDEFATHLRDELDLETLQRDLRTVVLDTVRPTHVSLWLREGGQ